MTTQQDHELSRVSIIEAIETLSQIAELEVDGSTAIAESHELSLQGVPITYRTMHWLHRKDAEKTMKVVRQTFHVILNYLKKYYKKEYSRQASTRRSIEGIKTIMLLVGEAAQKVDKYTKLFIGKHAESVKKSKEFKQLRHFYQLRIAPIVIQEGLAKWITTLPIKTILDDSKKITPSKKGWDLQRVLIDLDSVKKDSEYELFFIRKANGTRFFNPRLLKTMQLVNNFEGSVNDDSKVDFAAELRTWKDKEAYLLAKDLLDTNYSLINEFIKVTRKNNSKELYSEMLKAIMALMLASNPVILSKTAPHKTSLQYVFDFLCYFKGVINSIEFQKLITYPPKEDQYAQHLLVRCARGLCLQLFRGTHVNKERTWLIERLANVEDISHFDQSSEDKFDDTISSRLQETYKRLDSVFKLHSHLPLTMILHAVEDPDIRCFDSLMLQNFPSLLIRMGSQKERIALLKLPSPTIQEIIDKACVSEEFKNFIRNYTVKGSHEKHLIINLQDRTSWKEHARCSSLEELQYNPEFAKHLTVVTLAKDTDFYHQLPPYQDNNHAHIFIEQLLDHVQSAASGFYFPEDIAKKLFNGFAQQLADAIHQVFFDKQNVLVKSARQDFIELFYLFIELKIIELVHPTSVSLTCKDGLDVGVSAIAELFLVMKLINRRSLTIQEEEYLKSILFGEIIINRGRNLFYDRFSRLINIIKLIEDLVKDTEYGIFKALFQRDIVSLYKDSIFSSTLTLP